MNATENNEKAKMEAALERGIPTTQDYIDALIVQRDTANNQAFQWAAELAAVKRALAARAKVDEPNDGG